MSVLVHIPMDDGQPWADTRDLAESMGNAHNSCMALIKRYAAKFREFGLLRFQIDKVSGMGRPEKFALLNEDQCYLLLTLSRNTRRVVDLKTKLVQEFAKAREAGRLMGKRLADKRQQLHALEHESKIRGTEHARGMTRRRIEKRFIEYQWQELQGKIQQRLFGPDEAPESKG